MSDNVSADIAATNDDHSLALDLTAGSTSFDFSVFRNQTSTRECGASNLDEYDFYDAASPCTSTNTAGFYLCTDYTATYYVEVARTAAESCVNYELTVAYDD